MLDRVREREKGLSDKEVMMMRAEETAREVFDANAD